jgi:copper chaperone CopZ
LVKVEGYKSLKADVKTQTAQVTFDPQKTNAQALIEAINSGTTFKASQA